MVKKSAHTLWKGYRGCSGKEGGWAGLLGAIWSHILQAALCLVRSALYPGQYMVDWARSNMVVTPA